MVGIDPIVKGVGNKRQYAQLHWPSPERFVENDMAKCLFSNFGVRLIFRTKANSSGTYIQKLLIL